MLRQADYPTTLPSYLSQLGNKQWKLLHQSKLKGLVQQTIGRNNFTGLFDHKQNYKDDNQLITDTMLHKPITNCSKEENQIKIKKMIILLK